jgi:uncharacterized membrane protein YkoI
MTPSGKWAAALALAAALAAPPTSAEAASARSMVAQARDRAPGALSADEAAAIVAGASGGRVLDVRGEDRGERRVYRVKVLLGEGRVRVYRVDAQTGRILGGGS